MEKAALKIEDTSAAFYIVRLLLLHLHLHPLLLLHLHPLLHLHLHPLLHRTCIGFAAMRRMRSRIYFRRFVCFLKLLLYICRVLDD